jgi:membrane protease YdiL (CAAX protease family)
LKAIILKQDKESYIDHLLTLIILMIIPILLVSVSGVILSLFAANILTDFVSIMIIGVSMAAGFVIFPYLYTKKKYNIGFNDLGIKPFSFNELMLEFFIILSLYLYLYTQDYSLNFLMISSIQMLLVASTEEFWARGTICFLLGKISKNKWFIILVSSLSFAFLTHMNEPVTDNLLYRLPGALTMGIIFMYTKNLRYTILFHFAYNILSL